MQTKPRQVRVADPLWFKAIRKATRQGRGVAEVVRNLLIDWTADEPELTDAELEEMRAH